MTNDERSGSESAPTQIARHPPAEPEPTFADAQPLEPARVGPYLVEGRVGRGGMGEVFAVRDYRFDRQLALKRLSAPSDAELVRELFITEMRVTAALDHPNIIPILDRGTEDDGRPWFVMPLLRGRTLRTVLRDELTLPLTDGLQLFLKVGSAIEHAHHRRILHLDLKPANIFIGESGVAYVLDWGIARALDARGRAEQTGVGTPRYMAPEQADPSLGPIDERTDVFGLGTLLFTIATRRRPPQDRSAVAREVMASNRQIPARLAAIIARAMSRSSADRHSTVTELLDDVRGFFVAVPYVMLIHRTVRAGHEEPFERWARDVGRAATSFEGQQALTHVKLPSGADGETHYLMLGRFASAEHAQRFDDSPERAALLQRAEDEGFSLAVERIDGSGIEAWFELDDGWPVGR